MRELGGLTYHTLPFTVLTVVIVLGVAEMEMARSGPSWRCHEFRPDRIPDQIAQDPIDFGLGVLIERPATHLVYRLELVGMARTPQRRGDALIEHPVQLFWHYSMSGSGKPLLA